MKGTLVCFEGLDKSGKTSTIKRLEQILKFDEIPVVVFSFPNKNTTTWNAIQAYQQEFVDSHPKAIHLLYSSNRWELQETITEHLNAGYIVLLDRYFYSGIAYSCGYNSVDFSWACAVEQGLIVPDIIFYIDTPRHIRESRLCLNTGDRYENIQIQDKIESIYKTLITSEWTIIDGSVSLSDVCDYCCIFLVPFLPK